MKKIISILFLLLSLNSFSQNPDEKFETINLLNSGKTKIEGYFNNQLKSVWIIDTIRKTITKNILKYSSTYTIGPKFDNKYSIENLVIISFNVNGSIDTTADTFYDCDWTVTIDGKNKLDSTINTTLYKYNYDGIDVRLINRKAYNIKNGERVFYKSDYYGYNPQKQLILLMQDEGRVQYYFSYNKVGLIDKINVLGTEIKYKYDKSGRLISRISDTQKIYYEYYDNNLCKKKIIEGNNGGIWEYKYQ